MKNKIIKFLRNFFDKFVESFDEPHEKFTFNIILILFYSIVYKFISYIDKESFSEELTYNNSIYFSAITNFTLGYGDILPKSQLAKFAVVTQSLIFWMVAIAN